MLFSSFTSFQDQLRLRLAPGAKLFLRGFRILFQPPNLFEPLPHNLLLWIQQKVSTNFQNILFRIPATISSTVGITKYMSKGIEIEDQVLGTGEEALPGKRVVLNLRTFLHRGEEVSLFPEPVVTLDLIGRRAIPGLRKGILGMRVGGKQVIRVAPHLAYGAEGIDGKIPPNSLLRFEVELLDIQGLYGTGRTSAPHSQQILVEHPGESARNLPGWKIEIFQNGTCWVSVIFPPPQDMSWKYARKTGFQSKLSPTLVTELFDSIESLSFEHQQECLPNRACWSDSSERRHSITRDRETNTVCIFIDVWKDQRNFYFYMRENSPAFLESQLHQTISSLLESHWTNGKMEIAKPKPFLPD